MVICSTYGTPLASYAYDFKMQPEKNILLGYNLSNMSRIVGLKCMSISDIISYNTIYKMHKNLLVYFYVFFKMLNFIWKSKYGEFTAIY